MATPTLSPRTSARIAVRPEKRGRLSVTASLSKRRPRLPPHQTRLAHQRQDLPRPRLAMTSRTTTEVCLFERFFAMKKNCYYQDGGLNPDVEAKTFRVRRLELCYARSFSNPSFFYVKLFGKLHPGASSFTFRASSFMVGFRWYHAS